MLSINVEFLHGTFRGGSAADLALSGAADDRGEWPPSPARLYCALVAGGGTGERCRLAEGDAGLDLLESQPPAIYADPLADVELSPLLGRFAVIDASDGIGVQNYPARKAQLVRPGVRAAMRHPRVSYVWPDAQPDATELAALAKRAARVGYLGCADSPVQVTVSDEVIDRANGLAAWQPDPAGTAVLPVPYRGMLDDLDEAFAAWTQGTPRRRAWAPTRTVSYRDPSHSTDEQPQPCCVWLRFDRAVNGRRVLAVTETLRNAVLERYEALVAGGRDAVPSVLHGHISGEVGYQHAHWFALPHVGHPHADGRIRGGCIWLPAGTDPAVVSGVQVAAASIERLVRPRVFEVGVSFVATTGAGHTDRSGWARQPWSSNPDRWRRSARRWVSAFPVVQERFVKGGRVSLAEIGRWCEHAGLARPVDARLSPVPLLRGAAQLAAHEVFRSGAQRRPFNHLELLFERPVRGPIAVGRARQFGLGLMVPMVEEVGDGRR